MWPKKFEIGKWYKSGNILFKPLKYKEEGEIHRYRGTFYVPEYTFLYVQNVDHLKDNEHVVITIQDEWGAYEEDERKYLYHDPSENVLEHTDIELPKNKDFQNVIMSIFKYKIDRTNIL